MSWITNMTLLFNLVFMLQTSLIPYGTNIQKGISTF